MNALKVFLNCIVLFSLTSCVTTTTSYDGHFGERPDVQKFIQSISKTDNFSPHQLTTLFNQVQVRPLAVSQTHAPKEIILPWDHYRSIFLRTELINEGANFWHLHDATLIKAQQVYGVPPEIIVAIMGVETRYGKLQGKYRVIDALSTLAFNYPPRATFFQSELEQYLLLTRDLQLDPLKLYGSYAGAIGFPQFMPSSYRHLAVSETTGRTPDLWHNPNDAILSVAHYFQKHAWQNNPLIAIPAQIKNRNFTRFINNTFEPLYTVGQLEKGGVMPMLPVAKSLPANLLVLPTTHGPEYWIAFHNFYVITHYNKSQYYALAVTQLSQAILKRHMEHRL